MKSLFTLDYSGANLKKLDKKNQLIPILIADPFFNRELLMQMGKDSPFHFFYSPLPPDKKNLQSAFALFIRTRVRVNEEFLHRYPNVKIIVSATSGREHIAEEACQRRGVEVVFTGKILSHYVAEYIILLMLELSWKNICAIQTMKEGRWKDHLLKGQGLSQKTLGIIGLGSVGKALAQKAAAFDMKILSCNPFRPNNHMIGVEEANFSDLLQRSDFVSLNLPHIEQAQNFFGPKEFSLMKPSAFFINTARGSLVCENALAQALKNQQIAGAALDVFQQEPLPLASPLRAFDSLILTPHFATHNQAAMDLLTRESFMQLQNKFKKKEFSF